MEIKLIVRLETGDATKDQLEHIPEELRRFLEGVLIDWAPLGAIVRLDKEA